MRARSTTALRALAIALVFAALSGVAAAQPKIVIDPGHGGTDPGGTGTGIEEKNVVLDVSQRFKGLLEADTADQAGGGAWAALMTRSDDTFVSLAARSAYSNNQGADRFMSIHSNAFSNATANGTETFSYTNAGEGAALRNLVQAEMLAAWGLTDRGNKTENFAVLRETAAPAVLHELAFITNATDAAKLASPVERQKAALAHLRALQRHYGLAPYEPREPMPIDERGSISGRVVDDLGPLANAKVELAGGAAVVTPDDGTFTLTDLAVGTRTLTVSADGHETRVVEVAVAAGVDAQTEIALERRRNGEGSGTSSGGDDSSIGGGCATGGGGLGGATLLVVLGLVRRRARRAA
ncbi:MAG: N-acetylmuramoyl-L-alanine amidase [Kofleriaceae bacterium]